MTLQHPIALKNADMTLIDDVAAYYRIEKWAYDTWNSSNHNPDDMFQPIRSCHFAQSWASKLFYHPHISGQVELANEEIKQLLEKIVNLNRKDWSLRLIDAFRAYHITFKTVVTYPLNLSIN